MDLGRNDVLGELAADAELERKDFLVQSARQLHRFLEANADRIAELGGMTLIDEEPDFLSVAPDLTFRSRSRFLDQETGKWVSDTEVIESPAALVERINRDVVEILRGGETADRLQAISLEVGATGPAETAKFFSDETLLWSRVIKEANIAPQ